MRAAIIVGHHGSASRLAEDPRVLPEGAGIGAPLKLEVPQSAQKGPQSLDAVVLDTSALMAVLLGEPAGVACAAVLGSEARLLISGARLPRP